MSWTTSKILAYLIFFAGLGVAVWAHKPDILVQTSATAGAVIAIKTGSDAYKNKGG